MQHQPVFKLHPVWLPVEPPLGGNGISINTSQSHQIQCCTVLALNLSFLRLELDTELLLVLQCEYCTFKEFIG